jgi:hypothetical protein
VLDLRRDKYVALSPPLAKAALELMGARPAGSDEPRAYDLDAARSALVAAGILTDEGEAAANGRWRPPPLPVRTRWPSDAGAWHAGRRVSFGALCRVMAALAEAWLALKFLPFHRVIERVERERPRAARRSPMPTEQDILDDYVAARPWFPAKPICRLDAIALCLHLRRGGHPAALVFGVKLERFRAHCWVQCGDRVLNESQDIVARLTPLMAA